MMSKIKLVIVPCWLNLVMKELDIAPDDLANCEKLSGILSPRDLLIYKMVNFEPQKVFEKLMPGLANATAAAADFYAGVDIPNLEERASCANLSLDTLIYGATSESMIREGFGVEVSLTELDTMVVKLIPQRQLTDEQKACTDNFAKKASELLHARIGLAGMAKMAVFEEYINSVPVDPVFY